MQTPPQHTHIHTNTSPFRLGCKVLKVFRENSEFGVSPGMKKHMLNGQSCWFLVSSFSGLGMVLHSALQYSWTN